MSAATFPIAGELTIFTAGELRSRLLDALAGDAGELEVDLAGVTEIDTAGIQLMLAAKREAAGRGRTLHFTGHSAAVVELLDLYDLAGHFGDPMLLPHDETRRP